MLTLTFVINVANIIFAGSDMQDRTALSPCGLVHIADPCKVRQKGMVI